MERARNRPIQRWNNYRLASSEDSDGERLQSNPGQNGQLQELPLTTPSMWGKIISIPTTPLMSRPLPERSSPLRTYQAMVGSSMYVATYTRFDICYALSKASRLRLGEALTRNGQGNQVPCGTRDLTQTFRGASAPRMAIRGYSHSRTPT